MALDGHGQTYIPLPSARVKNRPYIMGDLGTWEMFYKVNYSRTSMARTPLGP